MPRSLVRDEHVPLWPDARVVVQCAERQAVEGRLEIEAAKQRRPADTAKSAVRTGRRLIEGEKLRALRPAKVTCFDACAAAKGCAVRLAAHRAMTVERATEWTGDLIPHASAKAAASNQHAMTIPLRVPAFGRHIRRYASVDMRKTATSAAVHRKLRRRRLPNWPRRE